LQVGAGAACRYGMEYKKGGNVLEKKEKEGLEAG
jgi:hypothetical protein